MNEIILIIGMSFLFLCVLLLLLVLLQRRRRERQGLEALVQKHTAETEAANHAKTIFLANMSYEIRTPLNSIIGFTELAKSGNISPETRDYLRSISENTERLLKVVNDISDISKIESGNVTIEKIPFNLHETFLHCQSVIMPMTIEKGIELFCYAEPFIGKKLLGDPARLRQVLINLLSNAVKFTSTGIVKFFAAIASLDKDSTTIHFEVKDSGNGMSPEQITKALNPFTQRGTGLGLPITKNLIEMMGGTLEVESSPGLGSKFSFNLKFDLINNPADIPTEKIVFDEMEKPYFESEILVLEDNISNQQLIHEHLARVGLKVVMANNGKEGVDIVSKRLKNGEKPFDLIFTDIHMPVMDGLEAALKITALGIKTPMVAMTANIMSTDIDLYKKSGLPDSLKKPFTTQELWKILVKYLPVQRFSAIDKSHQAAKEEKMLKKLKVNFARSNETTSTDIKKAINNWDIKLAHRLAHTIKSSAGQIEEISLQNTAAALEEVLEEGNFRRDLFDNQIELFEAELKTVLEKLNPLLQAEADTLKNTEPAGEEKMLQLFQQLEPMLKNKNPECINLLDDIRTIPGTEILVRQIENFEFTDAAATLSGFIDPKK